MITFLFVLAVILYIVSMLSVVLISANWLRVENEGITKGKIALIAFLALIAPLALILLFTAMAFQYQEDNNN